MSFAPPEVNADADDAVLADVVRWGQGLEGFKPEHARNALLVVRGYVEGVETGEGLRVQGIGEVNSHKLFLFALDLTWTFWLDEVFDGRAQDRENLLDVASVVAAILGGPARTPEAAGFAALSSAYHEYAEAREDVNLWRATAAAAVTAWGLEERLSKGREMLSYAEYVENGVNSTAVPHIVATASLLFGFGMAARGHDERVRRLVRNLSISCRLHNDLFSVEKERRESCGANAVLLLEAILPGAQCHRVVVDDLAGYERMLRRDVEALGPLDPFARLATIMPASHQVLYTAPRTAYSLVGQ